jgi:RNA polymerase sigma factor (sigma-70 family)
MPGFPEATPASLIEQLRGCGHGAGERFRELYLPMLRWIIRGRVQDEHDANDVTQTVYLKVVGGIDRYDGVNPFRNWLCGITKNVILQFRQAARRFPQRADSRQLDDLSAPAPNLTDESEDDVEVPSDSELLRELMRRALASCFSRMTEQNKAAVLLHFQESWVYSDIASSQGRTSESVRSAIRRRMNQRKLVVG